MLMLCYKNLMLCIFLTLFSICICLLKSWQEFVSFYLPCFTLSSTIQFASKNLTSTRIVNKWSHNLFLDMTIHNLRTNLTRHLYSKEILNVIELSITKMQTTHCKSYLDQEVKITKAFCTCKFWNSYSRYIKFCEN